MIQIFEDILQKRRWRGANAKATLERIENRLKKRIPPGQELQLTAFQETVINHPLFWRDQNQDAASQHLMIQGATSAGKTLVSELAIIDTIYCGELKKAIVLVPLKAMVRERTAHFREDMGHGRDDSEVRVYGSSGDYLDNDDRIINGEYEVAIIVYEKFFAMLSQNNSQKLMEHCDLLVVDELSVLSSEQRGPKLEMALEIVNSRYSNTRIMCLATCDCSTQKICNWLKIEKPIKSFARPVALEEHIVQLNGREIFRLIPENCSEDYEPKMQEGRIEIQNYNPEWRRSEKERRLLLTVMKELYTKMNDTRVLVFVPTQSAAANIADYLKEKIHEWLPTDDIVIECQYDQEFTDTRSSYPSGRSQRPRTSMPRHSLSSCRHLYNAERADRGTVLGYEFPAQGNRCNGNIDNGRKPSVRCYDHALKQGSPRQRRNGSTYRTGVQKLYRTCRTSGTKQPDGHHISFYR